MNEPVSIGLFLARPGDADFDKGNIFTLVPRLVVSGIQTFHVITATAPKFAGVDPYNEWIDRNSDDNVVAASAGGSS